MKKIVILFTIFILFTIIIIFCPIITQWDRILIIKIQEILRFLPIEVPLLPDCSLYSVLIAIPLLFGSIWFLVKKYYIKAVIILSVPLITFLLNCIIKPIVHRPRPPYEMQQIIHPDSFSYVSSHSLVTICLWGMVVYYFLKYCKSKVINMFVTVFAVIWTLFVGISRVWLGVHNPSDVLAAYFLGLILIFVYMKCDKFLSKM